MLYKRGNIWWVKFKAKSRTYQRSTGETSKREAQKAERRIRDEVAKELHLKRIGPKSKRTYEQALLKWIDSGAPKSMWSHARNTRPYLDHVLLHEVVPYAHEMKSSMLKDGLSPQTINRRLAVVRRVLNMAFKEWEWIEQPLGQKIKLLSEKGFSREFYLSQEEVESLVNYVDGEEARKVIKLAAYTGLRRGELLGLKPENWQKPYIVLSSQTKSKKPRTVPVIKELQELVTPPFQIDEHELRIAFEDARDKLERPDIRFHDLRHTYASWLAKNPEIPLTTIRDLLGHSNLTVTSKYSHLRSDSFDAVSKALKG